VLRATAGGYVPAPGARNFVAAGDRPLDAAYDRFAYLVKLFADRGYDEAKIRQDCPFLVQDVQFNALLCQAEKDLAQIARVLSEAPSPFEERAKKTAHGPCDEREALG
jgi:hypothetical protein